MLAGQLSDPHFLLVLFARIWHNRSVARRPPDSPPRDPQHIIDDQARQIERLKEDLLRSEIERNRLRRENERLKEELDMFSNSLAQ